MSAENLSEGTEGSSTEYWPESGSSVAGTLSPASEMSEELEWEELEWEELNPSLGNIDTDNIPLPEDNNELNAEFILYLEQFLLLNLFSLSPVTLWNIYTQLIVYYNMVATMPETQYVLEVPATEGDEPETNEGDLEPPILIREQ